MARGIHRIKDGWTTEHSVIVDYDGIMQIEMPESRYNKAGYAPPFEDLPWSNERGSRPKEKLDSLTRFRNALTSGRLILQNGDPAVLKRELEILKGEIELLEKLVGELPPSAEQ